MLMIRKTTTRSVTGLVLASTIAAASALTNAARAAESCGEVVTIATQDRTTTRYALAGTLDREKGGARIALVLLVGGGGAIKLDDKGCPQALSRNVLMRMLPLFHAAGFVTAMVDARSDSFDGDGLAGFRIEPKHADDLGKIIEDVRRRTDGAVWIVGHSRGTISAANAAARLAGPAAPDGSALLSAMMVGDARAQKSFVAQTVFDLPLEAIKSPMLIVGHAADNCVRSPAALMGKVTARTQSVRQQAATLTGGPIPPGRLASLKACEVREPHDFLEQEGAVAAGIARFVRGGNFSD